MEYSFVVMRLLLLLLIRNSQIVFQIKVNNFNENIFNKNITG